MGCIGRLYYLAAIAAIFNFCAADGVTVLGLLFAFCEPVVAGCCYLLVLKRFSWFSGISCSNG